MKTRKDLIFLIVLITWLVSSFIGLYFDIEVYLMNLINIFLFSILIVFKLYNKRFRNWLETPLKRK